MVEQVVEALVGLLRGAEASELTHRPQTPAVHRGVDAPGVGVLPGEAEIPLRIGALPVLIGVERPDLVPGDRLEERLAFLELRIDLRQPLVCAPACLRLYRHAGKSRCRLRHKRPCQTPRAESIDAARLARFATRRCSAAVKRAPRN